MIKKIIIGIFLGLGVTIFFMQEDEWVKDTIARTYAKTFSQTIGCSFSYTKIKNLNLFIPSIELEGVQVTPHNGNGWSWKAQSYTTSCSWLHIFLHGMIDMQITIDTLHAHSQVTDGEPAILEHIRAMAMGPAIGMPMYIKSLTLKNCNTHLEDAEHGLNLHSVVHSRSKKINHVWRSHYTVVSGDVIFNDRTMIDGINGVIDIDIGNLYSKNTVRITGNTAITLPSLPGSDKTCSINGQWFNGSGSINIKHAHSELKADPLMLTYTDNHHILLDGIIHIPLAHLWSIATGDHNKELHGACALHVHTHLDDIKNSLQITYDVEKARYDQQPIAQKINGFAQLSKSLWQGTCNAKINNAATINGTWQWDAQTHYGSAILKNNMPINVPYADNWQLLPHDSTLTCLLAPDNSVSANYQLLITHAKTNDTLKTAGSINLDAQRATLTGTIDNRSYNAHAQIKPHLQLQQLAYLDENGQPLLSIKTTNAEHNEFEGQLQFPFIRSLITKHIGYDVQGEGTFSLIGRMHDNKMQAQLTLLNGNIRLPETYNFINSFSTVIDFDLNNRIVALNDVACTLHKGTVACKRAVIQWDANHKPEFAHIPVVFDSCLLNMKRDLFAIISGALTLSQKHNAIPELHGSIIIDRAQLKENLFSDALQHDLLQFTRTAFEMEGADMACNINVETKQPIRVNTAFLETNAKVHINVTQTLREPKVSGSVELLSGSLHFPYRSLHITKGSIICLPDQLTDPHIELVAKNTIKKHNISLQVSGSLKDHHVLLESTPPLTEEQIVALLLVGSQQESLNAVMPALIMQNITNIVFASDQSPLKITEYFNSLLKPFRYIHLVPSFSDQSGRGGLRGALEVDIGDHWHALLQKNFSLTEDTRFELEYLFSDDISVRGTRDERKDLSLEGEVRWKF